MLQKESVIKYQEKLREMLPELIEDLEKENDQDLFDMLDIADIMVGGLLEVINEEFQKHNPQEAYRLSYEIW